MANSKGIAEGIEKGKIYFGNNENLRYAEGKIL